MRKSPCSAGVNGGFFGADAEGTPLGLVVQDGKRLSPLATGSFAVSGVVYDNGKNGLFLIRSSALKRMKKLPAMQAAIQGGPFLVENGTAVQGAQRPEIHLPHLHRHGRRQAVVHRRILLRHPEGTGGVAGDPRRTGEFPGKDGPESGRRLFLCLLVP